MSPVPVIAIFDIGKTNKKFLLFNEAYQLFYEQSEKLEEITDEDGDPCEDLDALNEFVLRQWQIASSLTEFTIKAVNVSAYGASFVYVDDQLKPIAPIYNYLKPFPQTLELQLDQAFGGRDKLSLETSSSWLGNLNSGFQLYRLKYQKPDLFESIRYALHLPQYLSSLFTKSMVSEMTSIGCHTALWDFGKRQYHRWVEEEGLKVKFPEIVSSHKGVAVQYEKQYLVAGMGLHDSSAALIPYLLNFEEAFVLLSTGTWCISLNPFNHDPLTIEELKQDCLCYLSYNGTPVKASRLFAGNDHEIAVKLLAEYFHKESSYYKQVRYNPDFIQSGNREIFSPSQFTSYEEAYHALVAEIVQKQKQSTDLVLRGVNTRRIFVDGGFSQNEIYMNLLSSQWRGIEVYAASMPQATALGAAMAIHTHWNKHSLPKNLIELKYYSDRG